MHMLSQPAGQGEAPAPRGSLASRMQGAVMEQVEARNPKPPSALLPKKLSLQLRTLTACSPPDHGGAGLPQDCRLPRSGLFLTYHEEQQIW